MRTLCIVFLSCIVSLCADWNREFDQRTGMLEESFREFQEDNYLKEISFFQTTRERLVQSSSLRKKIASIPIDQKRIFIRDSDGLVLKKRARDRIHELFAWELSHFLGASELIVPSFPFEIARKKVVIQRKEAFSIGLGELQQPLPSLVRKVSLVNYWRAHLMVYILGMGDLVGRNIGLTSNGGIRFFDSESSLKYCNEPKRTGDSFKTGFILDSMDWPQYRERLNPEVLRGLQDFLLRVEAFEEKINQYVLLRPFSLDQKGLKERLDKIRSFPFQEGMTFRDFYGFIYPKMNQGLDQLAKIVSVIMRKEVDHGGALFFAGSRKSRYDLSIGQERVLAEWIEKYID